MRRRFLIAAALAVCTVQYGMPARADSVIVNTVSVQFPQYYDNGIVSPLHSIQAIDNNYTAGVYPVMNWNMAATSNNNATSSDYEWGNYVSRANLVDGRGVLTHASLVDSTNVVAAPALDFQLQYTRNDGTNTTAPWPQLPWYPSTPGANGDRCLAAGSSFSQHYTTDASSVPASLTVTGLNPSTHYDIVAYITTPWWATPSTGSITTTAGTTLYLTTTNSIAAWVPITSTDSTQPTIGNCVELDNVSGSASQTLTIAGNNIGFAGFQLLTIGQSGWTWRPSTMADLTDPTNWAAHGTASGSPSGPGSVVTLGYAIGAKTVTVVADTDVTFGQLTLDNQHAGTGYNVAGAGQLTIDNSTGTGNGAITVSSGKHSISMVGGLVLAGDTDISIAAGTSLTVQSPVTVASGAKVTLTVGDNGTMKFTAAGELLELQTLSLGANAKLGLGSTDLLVKGDAANIASQIGSLTCTTAHGKGIGALTGQQYLDAHGGTGATFDGAAVDPTDAIFAYTWLGDTTLKGYISADDYLALDVGYLFGLTGWAHGQFLPGAISAADYAAIDYSYAHQVGAAAAAGDVQLHTSWFGAAYTEAFSALAAPVPEPASLALLALGGVGLFARRNKR